MAVVINGSGTVTGLSVGGLPDGTVDAGTLATDSVTAVKIPDTVEADLKSGRKNLIINGGMQVWQRGTSKTLTANDVTNYHTVDRWGHFLDFDNGSGSLSVTISQSTDVPSTETFSYSLKGATTPSSFVPSGSDNLALFTHKIETYNANPLGWGTSGAKAATLSYWIKSDTAGTGTLQMRLVDSSSVSSAQDGNYYTSFTINQANTWEYKTHLIPANSTDGWRRSVSNTGVHIHWYFGSNQSDVATEDAWFRVNNHGTPHSSHTLDFMTNAGEAYLTGVQLEVGSQATDFEYRSYGEELALCQRYYYQMTSPGSGYIASITNRSSVRYMSDKIPSMRDTPALSYNTAQVSVNGGGYTNVTPSLTSYVSGGSVLINLGSGSHDEDVLFYGNLKYDAEL